MSENRSEPPPTPDALASRIDAAITLLAQTQRERDNLRIERDVALAEIDRLTKALAVQILLVDTYSRRWEEAEAKKTWFDESEENR